VKENLKITEDTLLQYKNINSDLEKQLNDLAQMNTKYEFFFFFSPFFCFNKLDFITNEMILESQSTFQKRKKKFMEKMKILKNNYLLWKKLWHL